MLPSHQPLRASRGELEHRFGSIGARSRLLTPTPQEATLLAVEPHADRRLPVIDQVQQGFMVFIAEGREGVGAVRAVHADQFVLYVENSGEFDIPARAIKRVHDNKVILAPSTLTKSILDAVHHAHDREDPSVAG